MNCLIMWADQRIADNGHEVIRELIEIWQDCFQDSDEYIDFFFQNRFPPEHTLIAIMQERIVGVAYLLPVTIVTEQEEKPALFGYAIGVLKNVRGSGIGTKMLGYILDFCNRQNCIFLLHPANDRLVHFYHRVGLSKVCYLKKAVFQYSPGSLKTSCIIADLEPREYTKLRNRHFSRNGYIKWDESAVGYALAENALCGGFNLKISEQTSEGMQEYAVIGHMEGDRLIITETTIQSSRLNELIPQLAEYYRAIRVEVYLPEDSCVDGDVLLMIMGNDERLLHNGYANLLLC